MATTASTHREYGIKWSRFAIIAFLPIVKLRDVYPDMAAPLAVAGLGVLALPLLGAVKPVGRDLSWWWLLPILAAVQGAVALGYSVVPAATLAGNTVAILGAVVAGVVMYTNNYRAKDAVDTVLDALATLLVVSTALFLLGLEPATRWSQTAYSSILYSFDLLVLRGAMPLVGGAAVSTLAAVVFAGMLARAVERRRITVWTLVVLASALWGLALGDGRAAMFAALAGPVLAFLRAAWLRWAALLVPGGFIFLSAAASILPAGWSRAVSRTGDTAEIAGGNGRAGLWELAFDYLLDHPLQLFFGLGQYGQNTAGILDLMRRRAVGFEDTTQLSMHNVGVQALIDGGIIGFALTAVWLFIACFGLAQFRTGAAMMFVMLIAGVFDVWMTVYVDEGFFAVLLLGMVGIVKGFWERGVRSPGASLRHRSDSALPLSSRTARMDRTVTPSRAARPTAQWK